MSIQTHDDGAVPGNHLYVLYVIASYVARNGVLVRVRPGRPTRTNLGTGFRLFRWLPAAHTAFGGSLIYERAGVAGTVLPFNAVHTARESM